jgi:hypothetical protein
MSTAEPTTSNRPRSAQVLRHASPDLGLSDREQVLLGEYLVQQTKHRRVDSETIRSMTKKWQEQNASSRSQSTGRTATVTAERNCVARRTTAQVSHTRNPKRALSPSYQRQAQRKQLKTNTDLKITHIQELKDLLLVMLKLPVPAQLASMQLLTRQDDQCASVFENRYASVRSNYQNPRRINGSCSSGSRITSTDELRDSEDTETDEERVSTVNL